MKINRKNALIMLAAVWVVGVGIMFFGKKGEENGDIVEAFASGEYVRTVGQISAYVNYGGQYLSYSDRQDVAEDIANALGIDSEIELDIERKGDTGSCTVTSSYTLETPVAKTDISIVSIEHESNGSTMSVEQYVLVNVAIENSLESIVHYKKCLEIYFESKNMDADITLSLKGSVNGPLSNDEKNEICERILEALEGRLVTGSNSRDLYTVYGYTDNIKEYVVNGTTKSNINIAITYDSIEDVSWVYVATPILQEDY